MIYEPLLRNFRSDEVSVEQFILAFTPSLLTGFGGALAVYLKMRVRHGSAEARITVAQLSAQEADRKQTAEFVFGIIDRLEASKAKMEAKINLLEAELEECRQKHYPRPWNDRLQ